MPGRTPVKCATKACPMLFYGQPGEACPMHADDDVADPIFIDVSLDRDDDVADPIFIDVTLDLDRPEGT